ncbi:MAG: sigma-70 family RNA polymerase sigma factor [Actinomycetota bacterium]|nr:sigma-70 family RNA polymerase sigma factor [Actinomycetota bacterium]
MTLPPFQTLLDDHGVDVHRFCVAQAGPHHGPDCYQEAVIAALRAYPALQDTTNLRGWFFTVAHHKVLDHLRATARRPAPVGDAPDEPAPIVDIDGASGVWAEVATLPEKQRGAIALRFLADLPYAEIAHHLDCSEAAARQNVRAGLAGLRKVVAR